MRLHRILAGSGPRIARSARWRKSAREGVRRQSYSCTTGAAGSMMACGSGTAFFLERFGAGRRKHDRLRPPSFAAYTATSAALSRASQLGTDLFHTATPMLTVMENVTGPTLIRATSTAARNRSLHARAPL